MNLFVTRPMPHTRRYIIEAKPFCIETISSLKVSFCSTFESSYVLQGEQTQNRYTNYNKNYEQCLQHF